MKKVKIYKPSKTSMQSGLGKTKKWVLEFFDSKASINPLMGWESSDDTYGEIKLEFPDLIQNHTINYYKKIEQSMNENTSVFEINKIMFRNVNSVSKVIENVFWKYLRSTFVHILKTLYIKTWLNLEKYVYEYVKTDKIFVMHKLNIQENKTQTRKLIILHKDTRKIISI